MKEIVISIVIVALRKNPQKLGKGIGIFRNESSSRDYPDYSIIKIGQNTEKSPGDLRWLAVTLSLMEDHQLSLVLKTWIIIKLIIVQKIKIQTYCK